jgi:hypothetical protein
MLLVLKVPTRGAMNAMGWSQATWRAATSTCPRRSSTGIADRRFESAAFVSTTAGTLKRVRANGGFGPRGDVLGVPGGPSAGAWADIVDVHRAFGSSIEPNTAAWLVWLLDWGCAIWSLVDCRDPVGPMLGLGPERLLPGTRALPPADDSCGLAEQITQRHASDPA